MNADETTEAEPEPEADDMDARAASLIRLMFDRDNVTLAYGIARYLRDRDREQAQELYDAILEGSAGYSFGAIAAEAEVARPLSVPPHVAW